MAWVPNCVIETKWENENKCFLWKGFINDLNKLNTPQINVNYFKGTVCLIGELFPHSFHIFFAQLSIFYIFLIFFPSMWNLTNLVFCFWGISRIVTERLPPYIDTSPIVSKLCKWWKKSSPTRMSQEDDGQHAQHKTTLRQLNTIKNDSQKEQGIRINFSNNENEKR